MPKTYASGPCPYCQKRVTHNGMGRASHMKACVKKQAPKPEAGT